MDMKSVKCNNCGWVHFAVTMNYVIQWEADWLDFWNKSTTETREAYGCKDSPPKKEDNYLNCFRCSNTYIDFSDALDSDVPFGSTIQPILDRNEKET